MFDDATLRQHFDLASLMYLKLMYLRIEHAYASNVINSNQVLNFNTDPDDIPWQAPVPMDWLLEINKIYAHGNPGQKTLPMHSGWNLRARESRKIPDKVPKRTFTEDTDDQMDVTNVVSPEHRQPEYRQMLMSSYVNVTQSASGRHLRGIFNVSL